MKIIFMGTPEFAAVILSHLADSGHEIEEQRKKAASDACKGRSRKKRDSCASAGTDKGK